LTELLRELRQCGRIEDGKIRRIHAVTVVLAYFRVSFIGLTLEQEPKCISSPSHGFTLSS
jgi:hypothetical protein